MKYFKILGMSLVAMLVFGIVAASAFALPDVSIVLEGSSYPIHLNLADNGTTGTFLRDTGGNELSGKGLSLLFLSETVLSPSGTFEAKFLHVLNLPKKIECNNKGSVEKETVSVSGKYHIVTLTLAPLTSGILFEFTEFAIECGAVKVKVKGSVLSTLTGASETEERTKVCGKLEGNKKGKNNLLEYENDNSEKVKAFLEDNFGNGFLQAAEEVEGEVCTTALGSNMFVITGL